MIDAVQLRLDPTAECGWEPILATSGQPTFSCGNGTSNQTLFADDFEGGLTKWTTDQEVVYTENQGGHGRPPTRPPVTTPVASRTGPTSATVAARATRTTSPAWTRS